MKPYYSYNSNEHTILQTPTLWNTYKGYNYLIAHNNKAFVFDPGELSPILNTLKTNNLTLESIYLTHHHPDHVNATLGLVDEYGCPVYGFKGDQHRLPGVTHHYNANEDLEIAGLQSKALHLPGHTTGLCAFYFKETNWLFSNDLIFSLGCGRVFEGTYQQMYESLHKVSQLPQETMLFSSHEYTESNLDFGLKIFPEDPNLRSIKTSIQEKQGQRTPTVPTTLEFERKHNPFLRWNDPDLRKAIGCSELENWQYFERLRELKDNS